MDSSDEAFLKELLEDFKLEAAEHLQTIGDGLLALEKSVGDGGDRAKIEEVFRVIHSMKGAARAVNLLRLEQLAMVMEGVFHEIKNHKLRLHEDMFDVLYPAADMLQDLVKETGSSKGQETVSQNAFNLMLGKIKGLHKASVSKTSPSQKTPEKLQPTDTRTDQNKGNAKGQPIHKTQTAAKAQETSADSEPNPRSEAAESRSGSVDDAETTKTAEPEPDERIAHGSDTEGEKGMPDEGDAVGQISSKGGKQGGIEHETIRVPVARLLGILNLAEEMITSKNVLRYQSEALADQAQQLAGLRGKLDEVLPANTQSAEQKIAAELKDISQEFGIWDSRLTHLADEMHALQRRSGRNIDELIEAVRDTLLQPFSVLFAVVPRLVRDLSKSTGKKVAIHLDGADIEIDRRILEQLKDPLIHLIRNCIDHGIETPEVRRKAGKPDEGSLRVAVTQGDDRKISIVIEDDGAGIDHKKVVASAIKSGALNREGAGKLSTSEINRLIFASGLTTSKIITDVSGRGLGMAIVLEKITSLGGTIAVTNETGKGIRFTIKLPQTLATFHGILVESGTQLFLIPAQAVRRAIRVEAAAISTVESKRVVTVHGESIAMLQLSSVLGLRSAQRSRDGDLVTGLLLEHQGKKVVFTVDAILAEHEGIVKPLGKLLRKVKHVEGACFLGDGRIVPVLKPSDLIASAAESKHHHTRSVAALEDEPAGKIRVLAVDDSITIRNMMRTYLEMAGYEVATAFDGQNAFEKLLQHPFDIVVTDVEMPRMNGFELTSRIRKQASLRDLPVIVVTALETPEDRNRGMQAGANAYIVKSNFQETNLIDTIKRLV
ncbi:two-component system, chemotaxis family, sensor kinase CheA [Cyclonatronum proteinivorum]|uniref:histidine kinase n=1 Tax=Cyclonatronum proteinivorum TaxID=1457365 RepID=A0A345UKZ5_9BACT|nr:response regulator [Cyclonatronum proteinivorum]AXJ01147.1 two-component system, chemotaxis family, sensor kinase CheA [Cyclonatronum proteinivorum]